jgi:hypothetical protein
MSMLALFRSIAAAFLFVLGLLSLTSCATISSHLFSQPTQDWKSRNGQLLYRNAKQTIIGEVFVRFSKNGDFELTFSKGPGVNLLTLRQDAAFAQVGGAFAGPGWSGPVSQAPKKLKSWLGLRDKLIQSQGQTSIRYVAGTETFLFRF